MGQRYGYVEIRLTAVLGEEDGMLNWDVRCRSQESDQFRLIELEEVDATVPMQSAPGLRAVEHCLEVFLYGHGLQLALPFG
jgi:hypothetical protein